MVYVSLDESDESLIRYAGLISKMAHSEEALFLHVTEKPELPEGVCQTYPGLLESAGECEVDELRHQTDEYCDGYPDMNIKCNILEGNPLKEILKQIKEQNTDLLLVGIKKEGKIHRKLAEKLARKAPCSVLSVHQGTKPQISKIMTASDFSEYSKMAMDVGIAFAQAAGLSEMTVFHAYNVPTGYYKTGKSYEEFGEIMKKHSMEDYEQFMRSIDLKSIKPNPLFVLHKDTVKAIQDTVHKDHYDLVVVGARGRNAGAGVLLGSVTENLILTIDRPILAVKKKGAGLNLLDAILKL